MMEHLSCTCGTCDEHGRHFVCRSCYRLTPWCRGADDEYVDLCDDCVVRERAICQWREDRRAFLLEVAEKYHAIMTETTERVLAEDEKSLRDILTDGLDVGTVGESIVRVTLVKHPEYGWAFECEDGTMFRIAHYIK